MKTNQEIAQEVLNGLWGNGEERKRRLIEAGYNYNVIQGIVNALVYERDNILPEEPEHEETQTVERDNNNYLIIEYDTEKYDGIKIKFMGV